MHVNTNCPCGKRICYGYSENSLKITRHVQLYLSLWFVLTIQILGGLGKNSESCKSILGTRLKANQSFHFASRIAML